MWVEEKGAVLQVEQVKLSIFVRKKKVGRDPWLCYS